MSAWVRGLNNLQNVSQPEGFVCEVPNEVLVLQFPTQRRLLRPSLLGVRPGFQD